MTHLIDGERSYLILESLSELFSCLPIKEAKKYRV